MKIYCNSAPSWEKKYDKEFRSYYYELITDNSHGIVEEADNDGDLGVRATVYGDNIKKAVKTFSSNSRNALNMKAAMSWCEDHLDNAVTASHKIYCDTEYEKPGFLFEFKDKAFFYETSAKNLTVSIIRKFIEAICDYRNISDDVRERSLNDETTIQDFRRRIDKATLMKIDTGKIIYYRIKGNNFSINFPREDFENDVILF